MLKTIRPAISKGLKRPFFSSSSQPQKFTVAKVLPHSRTDLFGIISNIDAYASFVPYCVSSTVTERRRRRQRPHDDGTYDDELPTKADLTVGFKSYRETFSSIVRCTSPTSVEAVATNHPLFERLVTAWRLQDDAEGRQKCRVHLDIEYQFSNPMYGALSSAVLPKVADQIIEAFEKHAETVLGKK